MEPVQEHQISITDPASPFSSARSGVDERRDNAGSSASHHETVAGLAAYCHGTGPAEPSLIPPPVRHSDLPPPTRSRREVVMKPIDRQYICRGLVCFGAAIIASVGGAIAVFGGITAYGSPAQWLPDTLGSDARFMRLATGSFATGLTLFALSLLGCLGAYKRSKLCLWLFGLAVGVLLTCTAASVAIVWEAYWALGLWHDSGYGLYEDVFGDAASGDAASGEAPSAAAAMLPPYGNLSSNAAHTISALHLEVAALYDFCAPLNTTALDAIDAGLVPSHEGFVCTEPEMDGSFGAWVRGYCLDASSWDGSSGVAAATLLGEIDTCRRDLARAVEIDDPLVRATGVDEPPFTPAESTWLFCTCGRSLSKTVTDRWFVAVLLITIAVTVYLALLVCILCGACRGAAKAKKRKKKAEFERLVLREAAKEAGEEIDDDEL